MQIAYIIPTYARLPFFTFIINEMIEVRRAGHELLIVPLHADAPIELSHDRLAQLRPRAVFPAALFDWRVASLALLTFFRHPLRALRVLIALHYAAGRNLYAQAGLMAVIPKALATAWRLRQAKVDHIHAHFATNTATCAGIAAMICGIPFSFTAHAYDVYCTTAKLRNETLSWKLHHASQIFAVSEYAANLLRQKLPAALERIHTLYVGIPMDLFHEEAPPPLAAGEPLRLLCVAYYGEKKGLDTLIDACALLRDQQVPFHLRLYGEGPLRESLAARIASLGLTSHVILGGAIPQERVAQEMRACHVFVMPCRKDEKTGNMDGIPTVFMEAMAVGRPVISCPLSGIPELVRDGETGLLVPSDDAPALATALTQLSSNHEFRIRLGRQARVRAERQHDQHLNTLRLLSLIGEDRSRGATPVFTGPAKGIVSPT
jgi:glycosyltransferase involved in cell wall biosynthesis